MSCHSLHKGALALLLLLCAVVALAASNSNVLIVDLYLNDQHVGDAFVLVDEDNNYFLDESLLNEWQIVKPWPQPTEFRGANYYALNRFAGATAILKSREMRLDVFVPTALMPTRTIDMGWNDMKADSEALGVYLDYQLSWQDYSRSGQTSAQALIQPVVFGKYGNLSANTIYRHYSGADVSSGTSLRSGLNVLELTYTRDDPENLRSLRVGDVFTRPGSHGRSQRIGGIQFATNFETQPTFVTYPLPRFFGEASVPTALDVYVNGQLRRQENVEPGSYVLEDVPVVNGMGQLQVVTRDALGNQQVFTQDFYSSTELLKVGLSDYSVSIGAIREDYGIENFRYGEFAASGTWRYGWREDMTVEGHAEFASDLGMISGSTKYVIPAGGVVSAGLGLSAGKSGTGGSWQLGFRQQLDVLNYSVDLRGTTEKFNLIDQYEPPPKMQVFASAGKNLFELGSFGLSVVHREFHNRPKQTIVSANHSKTLRGKLSMSTYLSHVDAEHDNFSIGIRFSMPFGDRFYASGGFNRSHDQNRLTAELNKALPLGNGYGYRLGVSTLDEDYVDAGIIAQSEVGSYMMDVRSSDHGGTVLQASTIGSVAYLSGMASFTRQIRDAFAVVNVGNFEGVRVYAENIEIGRTDENGQLFVPGLHPYLRNTLRIEIEDLPLTARVGEVQTHAAPYYKSGVIINFDVSVSNNVLIRAVLPNGSTVPEGAYATINRLKKIYPVGQDGKLFLQGIDRSSLITLRWQNLTCDLDVPFPDSTAVIAKLGDIICDPKEIH